MDRNEIATQVLAALIGRLSIVQPVFSTEPNLFPEHVRIAACREAVEWVDTLLSCLAYSTPAPDDLDAPMVPPWVETNTIKE